MIQWLGICAFTARTWVQSLVRKLRSLKLCGVANICISVSYISMKVKMNVLVAQSCPILCDPMKLWTTRFFCLWDSPGKNTGVGCHSLSPGDLPSPETESMYPALQVDFFYHLSHQGSPSVSIYLYLIYIYVYIYIYIICIYIYFVI